MGKSSQKQLQQDLMTISKEERRIKEKITELETEIALKRTLLSDCDHGSSIHYLITHHIFVDEMSILFHKNHLQVLEMTKIITKMEL